MKSLRFRLAFWYAASLAVMLCFLAWITYLHLDRELRTEALERVHPDSRDWVLHAGFIDSEIRDILGELLAMWLVIGVPMLACSAGMGFFLARKSVQPVQELNDQLARIGPASMGTRVVTADADPELRQVVAHINELLVRLGEGYQRLGTYAEMVAHELRTPLMQMRLQIEDSSGRIDPDLSENLQEDLARLSGYLQRTLTSARAEHGQLEVHLESCDLSALVADLAEGHLLLAGDEQRDVRLEVEPGLHAKLDPSLFRQMFDNLVVNALQHGTGPVSIRLRRRGGAVSLLVANARAVVPASAGNGIGLRLVQALVAAQPGTSFRRHAGSRFHAAAIRWR